MNTKQKHHNKDYLFIQIDVRNLKMFYKKEKDDNTCSCNENTNGSEKNVVNCVSCNISNNLQLEVKTRKSNIHGTGLFAENVIAKNKFIIEYTGKVYKKNEMNEKTMKSNKVMEMSKHFIVAEKEAVMLDISINQQNQMKNLRKQLLTDSKDVL